MIQYFLPAVLAVVGGLVLWTIKKDRLSLEYDVVESDLFPRESGIGKYFVCALRNAGNRAIENISLRVEVSEGTIDSVEYSNSRLFSPTEKTSRLIQGIVPLLNPKERISAIITIKDAKSESHPNIEARAIGVTATKKRAESMPEHFMIFMAVLSGFLMVSALLLSYNIYTRQLHIKGDLQVIEKGLNENMRKIEELKKNAQDIKSEIGEGAGQREQGEPEREQIIFSILNRVGLSRVIPSLINISGEGLPFWKTGLHLMHSYLLDEKNARKYIQALEQLSELDLIAPSSKGFLLYLAGKIEKSEGNTDAAIRYFEICKKEAPLMHEYLMAQDPAYDLKSIKIWLAKNRIK